MCQSEVTARPAGRVSLVGTFFCLNYQVLVFNLMRRAEPFETGALYVFVRLLVLFVLMSIETQVICK